MVLESRFLLVVGNGDGSPGSFLSNDPILSVTERNVLPADANSGWMCTMAAVARHSARPLSGPQNAAGSTRVRFRIKKGRRFARWYVDPEPAIHTMWYIPEQVGE